VALIIVSANTLLCIAINLRNLDCASPAPLHPGYGWLTGIIDFYYACNSVLLYDLAVTVNDWCFRDNALDADKTLAILSAYHASRLLQASEHANWPAMLRVAIGIEIEDASTFIDLSRLEFDVPNFNSF
jgi:Ser/Thr protein kinase RdoA (MazF antagonist)